MTASLRTHELAVAWMHLAVGVFVIGLIAILWFVASYFAGVLKATWIPQVVAMFGKPFAAALLLIAATETAAAIGLLGNASWARYVLMGVSALEIFIFPIGTALSIYTYWVLLRRY